MDPFAREISRAAVVVYERYKNHDNFNFVKLRDFAVGIYEEYERVGEASAQAKLGVLYRLIESGENEELFRKHKPVVPGCLKPAGRPKKFENETLRKLLKFAKDPKHIKARKFDAESVEAFYLDLNNSLKNPTYRSFIEKLIETLALYEKDDDYYQTIIPLAKNIIRFLNEGNIEMQRPHITLLV